mgnify:CR=1 FL=1
MDKLDQAPKSEKAGLERDPVPKSIPDDKGQTATHASVLGGDGLVHYSLPLDEDQVVKYRDLELDFRRTPEEAGLEQTSASKLAVDYRGYLDEHGSPRHERFFPDKGQTKAAAPEQAEEGAPEPEKTSNDTETPVEPGPNLQTAYCHRGYSDKTASVCCGPTLDIGQTNLAALEQPRESKELKEMSDEVPDTVPRRLVTPDIANSPPRIAYPELRRWNTSTYHSPEPNGDEQPMQEPFIEDDFAGDENRECSDASGEYFEATLNEEEDKQHREPGIVFEERSKAGMTEVDEWKELVAAAILNLGVQVLVPGSFYYEKLVEQSNKLQDKRSTPDLLFVMTGVVAERAVIYGSPTDRRLAALCHFMLMGMNK